MSFFVEKKVKQKGNQYLIDVISNLYKTIEDNKHLENYADTVKDLKKFYSIITDGKGLCASFISMSKRKVMVNATTNMVMQDILNTVLTDKNVEFAKYTYIDNATYKSSVRNRLSLIYPDTDNFKPTFNIEFEAVMRKGGIKLTVEMLYVYLKTRTGE